MTHQQSKRPVRMATVGRFGIWLIALGGLILGAAAVFLNIEGGQKDQRIETLEPAADRGRELATGLVALCASNTREADELRRLGFCRAAVDVQEAAPEPEPTSDVSRAEILELIRQVQQENPPHVPVAQLLPDIDRLVRERYAENAPTSEELLALVQQVYLENPPKDGEDGAPCDPDQNPRCRGQQGLQGPGVVDVDHRVREDGGCDLVFFLFDPETGRTRQDVVPLPISCESAPPPTTTEPPPPTTTEPPAPTTEPTEDPLGPLPSG